MYILRLSCNIKYKEKSITKFIYYSTMSYSNWYQTKEDIPPGKVYVS